MAKSKKIHLLWKIPVGIILTIVALFVLVFAGFNLLKYPIYSDFYSAKTTLGTIPGLNNNFIPQGICVSEENDMYLFSGYTSSGLASRVYAKDEQGVRKYEFYQDNQPFKGHLGGIATTGDLVYLASGSHIYTVNLGLFQKESGIIEIGEGVEVNNQASFVFTDDSYLYVGEFNNGKEYVTNHVVLTNSGRINYAICTKYALDDLTTPLAIYSLPDRVQGFAITAEGNIALSTSYGLADSYLYYYDSDVIYTNGQDIDFVEVQILDQYSSKLKMPPMSEDLDYSDGKFISLTESACNKYIFGKFFFANYYFGIDENKIK